MLPVPVDVHVSTCLDARRVVRHFLLHSFPFGDLQARDQKAEGENTYAGEDPLIVLCKPFADHCHPPYTSSLPHA